MALVIGFRYGAELVCDGTNAHSGTTSASRSSLLSLGVLGLDSG
jgi:hypothetical protein